MKLLKSKIILVILLAILAFFLFKIYQLWTVQQSLRTRLNNLDNKTAALKSDNQSMEEEIELLQNKDNLEEVVRKSQVLKKPGEEALVIPEEILNSSLALDNSEHEMGLWQKIKTFFGL
ncbi:MAG TPA: septum formation initiator family protein [Candidatus Paceibacterota bacterium]|nr:septum formation initiator family protein [Candidatus Paceibacterota bacterium]